MTPSDFDEPIGVYVSSCEGEGRYGWYAFSPDYKGVPTNVDDFHANQPTFHFEHGQLGLSMMGRGGRTPTSEWMPLSPEGAIELGRALIMAGARERRKRNADG